MSIPFYLQYYVETERNTKYQWINYGIQIISLILHGIIFHWIPLLLRNKRDAKSLRYKPYFKFLKLWDTFNTVYCIKFPILGPLYLQPSLIILFCSFLTINIVFSLIDVKDLDYEPIDYIIAKRISRMAISNFPMLYLVIIKNDLVTAVSGIKHDRLILFHKWIARTMFAMIVIHVGLSMNYWLRLGFDVMLTIPPQIFGYIAFSSFFFLNFGSLKFIRRWAYDFFLVEHRIFSFIMLLLTFFHNMKGTEAAVILTVHQLVLDRILSRVLSFVHARMSPTRGKSIFEILDNDTILVTVPMRAYTFRERKWYTVFFPKVNTWKPGQHVYITVGKVKWFQQHPFTIASLSESKEMKFVIRVQNGFTKLLKKKILELQQNNEEDHKKEEPLISSSNYIGDDFQSLKSNKSTVSSINIESELLPESSVIKRNDVLGADDIIMKATFVGPVGGRYLPLITFDTTIFFSTGSGSSFTFPVCLDLLKTIELRNQQQDFVGRPLVTNVKMVWVVKKVENVQWYAFILEELTTYCNSGLLQMDIYVTQDFETDYKRCKEKVTISEGAGTVCCETENIETNSITTSQVNSSSLFETNNISFHHGRPDIEEIINVEANKLVGREIRSMALVSCGNAAFTHDIKKNGLKYKWITDAPDIYCYTESFE